MPSSTAVPDLLPSEPGGYNGYQALFGHRYVAPQLGAGAADVSRNGYQVTNAAGNLVDLNGNELDGAFLNNHPGFPGFDVTTPQSLAYVADMQEAGVPVTYAYLSDIHGNEHMPGLSPATRRPTRSAAGLLAMSPKRRLTTPPSGPSSSGLRLTGSPRRTRCSSSARTRVTMKPAPTSAGPCSPRRPTATGVTVPCTYPAGSFGELDGNLTGLLATEKNDTTPLSMENDTAPELYVTGDPSPASSSVRTLDRDVGSLTAPNPYTGQSNQPIVNYMADSTEEAILHLVNADPARTPTLSVFAKPDYYLYNGGPSCSGPCVSQNTGFAWDHGDYAAEIDTNYVGFVGPGVRKLGLDGSAANAGPNSAGANSGHVTVPDSGTTGTWVDETDIRPTLMYLTGLRDDYEHDGRVISEILQRPNAALSAPGVAALGACYKQLNSSVGVFGTDTLVASTAGLESTSPGDHTYAQSEQTLAFLDELRDAVAGRIKLSLDAAAFADAPVFHLGLQSAFCASLLQTAGELANGASGG